jgi:hypothetical protein
MDSMPADIREEIVDLFRRLGGQEEAPPFRPGAWDLTMGDLVIELDEELHFNRFRAMTLDVSWASDLPWAEDYRVFCREYESRCLSAGRWGKRWTSPSTARMFSGGDPGDLEAGAPRWKQRALYDAIKDTAALSGDTPAMARLSIYDRVEDVLLEDALVGAASIEQDALLRHLAARTA